MPLQYYLNDSSLHGIIAGCYAAIALLHIPWRKLKPSWKFFVTLYALVALFYTIIAGMHHVQATDRETYSAASASTGAASRTSRPTWASNFLKFSRNIETSLRACAS